MADEQTAPSEAEDDSSIFDSLVPSGVKSFLVGLPGVSNVAARPAEQRDLITFVAFAALIFLPWLGAVGTWDPWENHYGEVAREMVYRHDYVYPYWESAWFFSKPVLLMWMMSIGMNVVGINSPAPNQPIPVYTEWAIRLPVAIAAIFGAALIFLAVRRIFGRRLAFLTGLVLITSPYYFFLARQCMEDMPLVVCVEASIACFLMAEFTTKPGPNGESSTERASPVWWYLMYAFAAFATLAKESLGIALPGLIIFTYLVLSWDWSLLKRARLLPGAVLFLAICAPWYVVMILFRGHDDEWSTFAVRLAHDNTQRFFTSQIHSTTPVWTFSYFIEQVGWGFFPWVGLLPGMVATMARLDFRSKTPQARASLLFAGWVVAVFAFFSFSGTKFHHYIFPVFPALAFCTALFIDRLWREGLGRWLLAIFAGIAVYALIASNLYAWHDNGGIHSGLKHLTDLFVYNYDRPYPFDEDRRDIFAAICVVGGAWLLLAFVWRSKTMLFSSFGAVAVAIAIWGSWFYWRWMSPNWSQRDEFWVYYQERIHNEPIAAFLMNWRGETFYSRNTVKQLYEMSKAAQLLHAYGTQAGPKFLIVEQDRFRDMTRSLGSQFRYRVADRSSNKFFLVEVTQPCNTDSDCSSIPNQVCDEHLSFCVQPDQKS
jgi:4-amino-4-deoxy-L-arabinose transferase-like glycosyltransferase